MPVRSVLLPLASALALAALTPFPLLAQGDTMPAPDAELEGLWGTEALLGPAVRGELLLEQRGDRWTLRAGGLEAAARADADTVRISLPGGAGTLRIRLGGATEPHAMWIQPSGNLPEYASPVMLRAEGPGAWRGTIRPLDDHFSLYLLVRRAADGSRTGIFRNPEFGWNAGRAYRLSREDDNLAFTNIATGKVQWHQPYDPDQRTILFDFGAPLQLRPLRREEARGFYPRIGAASYVYRVPLPGNDGWVAAPAAETGMDQAPLVAMVERLMQMDPASDSTPLVHSVLVARHGKLVLEEYFYGFTPDRLHDMRSASKTMTSLMVGAAMDRGAPFTTESPVYPIFGLDSMLRSDLRRARITVGQLLTHSTGLACDDNDETSPGNEERLQQQRTQPDWYRYMLDLPVVHEPGSTYAYCSGTMNLAAGVVARATGRWLPEFFDESLAQPLDITDYAMNLMPNGEAYGGGGLYLRPRDLLKFGQLVLTGGTWNGVRVVSKRWIERSTASQIVTPDGSSDGFGWHRHILRLNGRSYQEVEANGNGGQFLIVVPELDLVVVFTAGNYNHYGVWRKLRDEWVPRYVMAAVRR